MSDKVQLIKEEIERIKKEVYNHNFAIDYSANGALDRVVRFIDSLPKEHNEDLEQTASLYWHNLKNTGNGLYGYYITDAFKAGAEWQKQKDEKLFKNDSWNYIEENYPNISQEEKLRLYDISIKSRLAGAKTQKKLDQETIELAEEHAMLAGMEKMREGMMKDAVDGEVVYQIGSSEIAPTDIRYKVVSDRVYIPNVKLGDKVKIIIIKEEQQ